MKHRKSTSLLGCKQKTKYINALNAFKKGVELINKGYKVAHGYDAVVLKQSLENNVKQLNRIYGFH